MQAENVFYLYLCIWIAYAECQWLDGLSSPSEFISSIKLSNYLFMSWEEDMYACMWKHAQQCHLALESRGSTHFCSSSLSAFCFYEPCEVSIIFEFSFKVQANFHVLHLAVVLESISPATESHYIVDVLMIGVILIISFPYKTGNHKTLLWKF